MSYTPVELRHVRVGRSLFGYNRAMVEQIIEEVAQSFEVTWRERGELIERVEAQDKQLIELRQREQLLTNTLVAAERTAADVRERAKREADAIINEARNEAREVARSARAEQERLLAETRKIEAMLRGALGVLNEAGESVATRAVVATAEVAPAQEGSTPPRAVQPALVPSEPVPSEPVPPEPVQQAPAESVRFERLPAAPEPGEAVADEPVLVEAASRDAIRFPQVAEEVEREPEPVAAPWGREDTREFEPISVPELADDTIEPLHRLRLDKPAQGDPRREARPTRASRDFDWGE